MSLWPRNKRLAQPRTSAAGSTQRHLSIKSQSRPCKPSTVAVMTVATRLAGKLPDAPPRQIHPVVHSRLRSVSLAIWLDQYDRSEVAK